MIRPYSSSKICVSLHIYKHRAEILEFKFHTVLQYASLQFFNSYTITKCFECTHALNINSFSFLIGDFIMHIMYQLRIGVFIWYNESFLICIGLHTVYAAHNEQHLCIRIRLLEYFFENKMSPVSIISYTKRNIGPVLYKIDI